jgi:3-oxoacyl-[acyl-carrier protein] reductase
MSDERPVVVITGAGQGLGRAFAESLSEAGWALALLDINADNAAGVAEQLRSGGGSAVGLGVDVTDPDSLEAARAAIADQLGPVTGLVNNAALFSTLQMGGFEAIDPATWRRVIDVNVTGVFLACQAFVPGMREAGYGKIVNISSATVVTGRPGYLHYVTSKAALIGLSRSLASEVGPDGIRVNTLAPGSTETEIERATITRADRERMAAQTALRRVQVPADLTGAVEFLLSPGSDFVTGQFLVVDGGLAFH